MHAIRMAVASTALMTIVTFAQAAGEPVALGEVSSSVTRGDLDLRALLRSASEEELRAVDWTQVHTSRRAILSMSLVRMDSIASRDSKATTCVVSATLRDAKRGAIFAILEGRARATSDPSAPVERSTIQTAVRGALARIPEALRP
jgi:hypothetical protein